MGLRSLVLPAVLLTAGLLLTAPDGLTGFDVLAVLAATSAGLLAGALWPTGHGAAARVLAAADDLLGASDSPHEGGGEGEPSEVDPEALGRDAAPAALDALLGRLSETLAATRVVLWRVDHAADRITAERADGPLPRPIPAAGSPLTWALVERSAIRLDPVPPWAGGAVVAAPVDQSRVLTVETSGGEPPGNDEVRRAAAVLAPFLRLHDRQAHVVAAAHRLDRLLEYLAALPREGDSARVPAGLARAAMEIMGGSGALVASWATDEGRVLAREGQGGGPAPGSVFRSMDGDLAHAARTPATVRREPVDPTWPALASSEERWQRPRLAYRTVIPLVDPRGEATGLLAVWGRTPPPRQGIALLEAVAPLLALQLRQAGDLEQFRERATLDPLTGLHNRATLEDRLAEETARFHRYRHPAAVLVVDLDHFKRINDTHGHDAGDAVLSRVGEVVGSAIRDVDFAARFGGEELVVLLPETMLRPALDVAERVRAAVEGADIEFEGTPIPVTASIGVSACPDCVEDPDALFPSADQALYVSKTEGRNRVTAAPARTVSGGAGG